MKENDIRPKSIFDEYLRLAQLDADSYFTGVERVFGLCPACESVGISTFEKYGFVYELCPKCETLYVNPRPIAEAFADYYTKSPSSKYWASTFYKETAKARREILWKPKASLILKILTNYASLKHRVIDIGGGLGLFAEELRAQYNLSPVVIEPGPDLALACREKRLEVIEKFLEEVIPEDLPVGPHAFVSFELFEHLHDPSAFLRNLSTLMNSGDLFIFTTLSSYGLDIQVLWEGSKSVTPPHHLNFFNPYSVALLLCRLGFETLDISTPGCLDIDILYNNKNLIKDRFWKTFMSNATEIEKSRFQQMISSSGWSSHMMIVCRKP